MRQPWLCTYTGHQPHWHHLGDALICQCARRRCRTVLAISPPPERPRRLAALDALQNTNGRPALDWPGCTD